MASTASTEAARDGEPVPRSRVPGIVWPAIPDEPGAQALAMQYQLAQSQWWSPDAVLAQQRRQLAALVRHAADTVPYYRGRLPRGLLAADGTLDWGRWREVPILTREALQRAGPELVSGFVPRQHGGQATSRSSGSTGRIVEVRKTGLVQHFWDAFTLREHLWHRRDFTGKLAAIRAFHGPHAVPREGGRQAGWGASSDTAFETGESVMLDIHVDAAVQAAWLLREDPDYLITYPSNALALAEHFAGAGLRLARLREVRTVGEPLTQAIRAACRRAWNVPVTDVYSTHETGYLAIQCPEHEHYHVQAEGVLLEILDDAGRPCAAGEIGRVVVTPLHNFAGVLLRYEIGDYAEAGGPCPCGRGLAVIARIMGRYRNHVVLPDGSSYWPWLDEAGISAAAPVRQLQVVQKSLEKIELRYVAERDLTEAERQALSVVLGRCIGHPFQVGFTRLPAIPRSAGGKFEDFICEVPRHAS